MPDVGQTVGGKYRLERIQARGGMGSVWRAEHVDLGMPVAVKFLRPDLEGADRPQERFVREAKLLAQLQSPHVVRVLDFGKSGDDAYLVMEFLEGQDLALLLEREGALAPDRALGLICQAARGLAVAHQRGLVHRDLKPSNLFVCGTGPTAQVKLIDFGIAKQLEQSDGETTRAGTVLGSPAYMSPEQARGGDVGMASDLWSLSAVLYRMLTGERPFSGVNEHDLVVRLCTTPVPSASSVRPGLGTCFDEFFVRCLARDPNRRPRHLQAWCELLRDCCESHPQGAEAARELQALALAFAPLADSGPQQRLTGGSAPSPGRREATGSMSAAAFSPDSPTTAPQPGHAASPTDENGRGSETLSVAVAPKGTELAPGSRRWRWPTITIAGSVAAVVALGVMGLFSLSPSGSLPPPPNAGPEGMTSEGSKRGSDASVPASPGRDLGAPPSLPREGEAEEPSLASEAVEASKVSASSPRRPERRLPEGAGSSTVASDSGAPPLEPAASAAQEAERGSGSGEPSSAQSKRSLTADAPRGSSPVDGSVEPVQEETRDPIFGLPVVSP